MSAFIAGSVIASPVFDGRIDGDATVEKTCRLIEEAASKGARLIVFPETYIPIYPWWVFMAVSVGKQQELFRQLFENSFPVDSPQIKKIAGVCRQTGMVAVIGLNEKDGYTLYNSQVFIDQGKILGVHRKLVPTGGERTVWGRGDGSGVRVFETSVGKIGGLICYEHSMVPARYALYSMGEEIHVANFPGADFKSQQRDRNKVIDAIIRSVAFEGQVFVCNSTTTMSEEEKNFYLDLVPGNQGVLEAGGGIAAIVDPFSNYIGGPMENKEGIVYGEIDLKKIILAKHFVDSVGHYARPDIFTLLFNNRRLTPVEKAVVIAPGFGGGLSREAAEAIKVLKNSLQKIQDDEVAAAIEELAKLI